MNFVDISRHTTSKHIAVLPSGWFVNSASRHSGDRWDMQQWWYVIWVLMGNIIPRISCHQVFCTNTQGSFITFGFFLESDHSNCKEIDLISYSKCYQTALAWLSEVWRCLSASMWYNRTQWCVAFTPTHYDPGKLDSCWWKKVGGGITHHGGGPSNMGDKGGKRSRESYLMLFKLKSLNYLPCRMTRFSCGCRVDRKHPFPNCLW